MKAEKLKDSDGLIGIMNDYDREPLHDLEKRGVLKSFRREFNEVPLTDKLEERISEISFPTSLSKLEGELTHWLEEYSFRILRNHSKALAATNYLFEKGAVKMIEMAQDFGFSEDEVMNHVTNPLAQMSLVRQFVDKEGREDYWYAELSPSTQRFFRKIMGVYEK